jgi:hypothetical protein
LWRVSEEEQRRDRIQGRQASQSAVGVESGQHFRYVGLAHWCGRSHLAGVVLEQAVVGMLEHGGHKRMHLALARHRVVSSGFAQVLLRRLQSELLHDKQFPIE